MRESRFRLSLKSFFASVECIERGLDPLKTNLVVADISRTEKTICLAVTPSLKEYGISGRARLFEVVQAVERVNNGRACKLKGQKFDGESFDAGELIQNANLKLAYIVAPPQMAKYIEYSERIYSIYLKYVASEDMHIYSIDEVFIDITNYLRTYKKTPRELAEMIIRDVVNSTGITATAGIGSNMYLAKIAMDINAKKMPADKFGMRIAELDELSYRRELWEHTPLTDFWRVGAGYAKKLEANGFYCMGDIARASLDKYSEDRLYKLFGVNAELLIDHAWGYEPCTIADIRAYKPENKSIGEGQVLHSPYGYDSARLIVREMVEFLCLKLVTQKLVTDQIVLTIGYDIENITDVKRKEKYKGEIVVDSYGREIPKHARGTVNIGKHTSSAILISNAVMKLFDDIANYDLLVRRINVVANHILDEQSADAEKAYEQLDLFSICSNYTEQKSEEESKLKKERVIQKTTVKIREKFGKNAILKGFNLLKDGTTIERNKQIGGHKATNEEGNDVKI